ncbi:hypothetical protein [Clostridium formicaceticum]|uniref:Uncharacterized protein n=1 Tax=Clostridium formicaceticum TaxID=1497 RepID=A0AAC9WFZ3_9CLOT|nr:hypothetical protein [Clostridium formicaceticum]AOY76782.1 hypothetical protein BJL90_13520 [Clostridium formicaceticum]ARE87239.1 hypothetical protein CLFO_16380 [Clostridium formicaceticum]
MSNEDKMFSLLEKMYGEFTSFREETTKELKEIKTEVADVKKTVIKIENDHGKKLSALFDGYKQNSEKLERIEQEVSKHEEMIYRRVR